MSHLNRVIQLGRRVLEIERLQLAGGLGDAEYGALDLELREVLALRQLEIVAAHRAGASWETIEDAMRFHGQHVDRVPGGEEPSPADVLDSLLREHGAEWVVEGLDWMRAAVAEHGVERVRAFIEGLEPDGRLVLRDDDVDAR
ncbi:hypothetical protein [Actinoplanes sp. NBRC 101535]|uniref:hypothetical protein n=1 Tax=Actinoplanes sp. NBRC 101535 TaxID=3032196 RepID=UPI0024A10BB1|nr:hypothetical protein [Actinoplanes sp. NBRC 101535]GLY08235.1 hypothetical protein Acsp01_86140 [Actinoplanes sp. NBRC 101535]